MEWIRLMGYCLLAAVIVMTLRQMNPAFAGVICAAFGVMIVSFVLPQIRMQLSEIEALLSEVNLQGEYYQVMLKAMGIVMVTQIAVRICQDLDAFSIAQRAEMCGRLALLGVIVPVFVRLTRLAVGVLR